ncbi:hypothetical protein [Janibacter sp. LM]|uniref:hypothetical protein n=1 Tax=Janibacter sp. LM TaxID=3144845 RepID=UPI0031F6A75C
MNDTLFGDIPTEGDTLALPGGATVPARMVDAVPATGETIVVLGIEWDDDTPRGAFYGVVTIDELGIITGTLDGLLPCPCRPGDALEVVA